MLDRTQFADGIGQFNNIAMTAAAGDDHRLMGRALTQGAQHRLQRQVIIRHHVGQLVQQHQIELVVSEHTAGMLPDRQAGGGVAVAILGVPGETCGHHLKFDAVRLQQITLAVRPGPLDKLDHADFFAMADGAGRGAKGGGGFAFAVAGKDHHNTALVLGRRHPGVNFIFQPLLAFAVAFITHWAIPGLRPGWASKVIPVLRRLSSPISHR